jgi:hypothetical protein
MVSNQKTHGAAAKLHLLPSMSLHSFLGIKTGGISTTARPSVLRDNGFLVRQPWELLLTRLSHACLYLHAALVDVLPFDVSFTRCLGSKLG